MSKMLPTTKKKQEEKHMKTLRELASLPSNKNCFDCHQRGPTYVNMTVGSFVCVSCSGKVRGLNPPHRVKSISMASFTADEVEFLKLKGNEVCHPIWLGTYNPRHNPEPDVRDDHKTIDFLIKKYEKKSWYVEPSTVARSTTPFNSSPSPQLSSPSSVSSAGSRSAGSTNSQLQPNRSATPRPSGAKVNDLLAGLSLAAPPVDPKIPVGNKSKSRPSSGVWNPSQPSPWDAATTQPSPWGASQPSVFPQASFANFDNFADFDSNPVFPSGSPSSAPRRPLQNGVSSPKSKPAPPSEDKYAALKDLDLVFGGTTNNNEVTKVEDWNIPKGITKLTNGTNRASWAGSTGGLNIFDAKVSVFDSSAPGWGTPPKSQTMFPGSMNTHLALSKDAGIFSASPNPFAGYAPVLSGSPALQQFGLSGSQNPFSSPNTGTLFGKSPADQSFLNGNVNSSRLTSSVGQQGWPAFGTPFNGSFSPAQSANNLFGGSSSSNPFASGISPSVISSTSGSIAPRSSFNPFL